MSTNREIHTEGAASIGGNAQAGRDIIGRDQINIQLNPASKQTHVDVSVEFFAIQETSLFVNTPGRYADQIHCQLHNHASKSIRSFKLEIIFPKLETLIDMVTYKRFAVRPNVTDFKLTEKSQHYAISYRSSASLLAGDTWGADRAFLIYAMELPDKDRWLQHTQNFTANIQWKLFLDESNPLVGEQDIRDIYRGEIRLVNQ